MIGTRQDVVATLDIGSSKISCLIAEINNNNQIRVISQGTQATSGIRNGIIVDITDVQISIARAVQLAEKKIDEPLRRVFVSLSSTCVKSHHLETFVAIGSQEVKDQDLSRIISKAQETIEKDNLVLLHTFPLSYQIDGNHNIKNPKGMFGHQLGMSAHLVTANTSTISNLLTCVTRCHLEVEAVCLSSYAASLACLQNDEIDLGVTLIDIGAQTTSIVVYLDSNPIYFSNIPVGGQHITSDIAKGLTISFTEAERLKNLYGHALLSSQDIRDYIKISPISTTDHDTQPQEITKATLISIIQPRLEEIFEMIAQDLVNSGLVPYLGNRIVLTGGTSQLAGIRELAANILKKQVRIGKPAYVKGLDQHELSPQIATSLGLVAFGHHYATETHRHGRQNKAGEANVLKKVGKWLKENF